MGQKVHPLGFRIGATQDHYSHWFAKPSEYPQLIQEDKLLRNFINRELTEAGIAEIIIQRKAHRIELEVHAARPGIIVGRRGVGIEKIRQDLEKLLSNQSQISINVVEISNPSCKAKLIAESISQALEKRVPFRRAVKGAIQKAQRAGVKGIKIQVSGRLNGAEIARSEWVREGSVSLQTLRAKIDYCYYTAQTIYGILGIKVWVSNGNEFEIKN